MLLALLQQQDMSGTGESLLDNGTKHISDFFFALTCSSCCQEKQLSPDKSPIDIDEMIELMQQLSKWSAYYKAGTVPQKTEPHAHALVVKWNKFKKEYENRIKHFLPCVGDHQT